jgi:hypothetical protein
MQTAVEALDDDALFGVDEDDEEEGEFVMYVLRIFLLLLGLHDIVGVISLMLLVTTSLASVNSVLHPSLVYRASVSRRNFSKARTRVEMSLMLLRTYRFLSVRTSLTMLFLLSVPSPANHRHHSLHHHHSYPSIRPKWTIKSAY